MLSHHSLCLSVIVVSMMMVIEVIKVIVPSASYCLCPTLYSNFEYNDWQVWTFSFISLLYLCEWLRRSCHLGSPLGCKYYASSAIAYDDCIASSSSFWPGVVPFQQNHYFWWIVSGAGTVPYIELCFHFWLCRILILQTIQISKVSVPHLFWLGHFSFCISLLLYHLHFSKSVSIIISSATAKIHFHLLGPQDNLAIFLHFMVFYLRVWLINFSDRFLGLPLVLMIQQYSLIFRRFEFPGRSTGAQDYFYLCFHFESNCNRHS